MKRILLVALVACLCMAIVIPAAVADGCGSYTETYTVFMPQYTETTTTTYGCYQQTTVEYQCPPAPCQPCPPPPCQPAPCVEERAIKDACKRINKFTLDVLKQLDRELEGTGWVRVNNSKRKLLKTGRCIYTVTVKNQETGEKITCFLVARTAEDVVRKMIQSGDYDRCGRPCNPCSRCHRQHAKCSEYSVMFVWNYNTGCNAAYYEDEWYITEYGQSDGEAVCEFVTKLVADEVYR